jgi:hypothetical protein
MKRTTELSMLVLLGATLMLAACEPSSPKAPPQPKATTGPMDTPATRPAPPPASSATDTERKESTSPQQGQVDPKAQGQSKDFETKK